MMNRDVIIIGAGASGLMCAREAARRGRSVLVLDHAGRIGKKILISGGGCCNFTNRVVTAAQFISGIAIFANPRSPVFFRGLLRLHEASSHLLLRAGRRAAVLYGQCRTDCCCVTGRMRSCGVEIALNHTVTAIEKPDHFIVRSQGKEYACGVLVVATGGLSWPHLGATDLGFRIAGNSACAWRLRVRDWFPWCFQRICANATHA